MSKQFLTTFLCIIGIQLSMAQIPYQDAIRLREYARPSGNDIKFQSSEEDGNEDYIKILMKYVDMPEGRSEMTKQELGKYFDSVNNVFITKYLNLDGFTSSAEQTLQFNAEKSDLVNPISGLNITTIVDGLAKFLVERTKQELSIAFFDRFRSDLEEFEELKTLFPQTHELLVSIGDEIYNFSTYINMLREAFQEDIKTIIPNLKVFIDSGLLEKYLAVNPEVNKILSNALLIAEEIQNGEHPGDILNALSHKKDDNIINNFHPSIQVLDLISQSLRSIDKDRYWISYDELGELIKDDVTLRIYLGLLYEKSPEIIFQAKEENKTFRKLLESLAEKFDSNKEPVKDFLKKLVANTQRIDQSLKAIDDLKKNENKNPTYAEHYEFYTASIDLLEHSLRIFEIPVVEETINFKIADLKKYFKVAHATGDLYLNVREQKYFGALLNLHNIIDEAVFDDDEKLKVVFKKDIEKCKSAIEALETKLQKSSKESIQELDALIEEYIAFNRRKAFRELIKKRASFKVQGLDDNELKKVKELLSDIAADLNDNNGEVVTVLMERYKGILPKLLKYGNLAVGIAQAESSDEVKNLIESIALPVGSASIKKKSKFNVALNAYVGFSPAIEYSGDSKNTKFSLGLNAPIGVATSWDLQSGKKEHGSFSIFVPLIDIGAVTNFRFEDDETEELPEIKLENIFAPGLYFVHGWAKLPISWGIGGQLGPQLREVEPSINSLDSDLSFSIRAFIAVDIPLLNFYTRSRD
ncbi:MAG: hypothetical protein AAGC45_13130 [Bacteroidota bacterium]